MQNNYSVLKQHYTKELVQRTQMTFCYMTLIVPYQLQIVIVHRV